MLALLSFCCAAFGSDLDTLRARLYAGFGGSGGSAATMRQWLGAQKADGTWPDINYADSGRAVWAPSTHLSRMLTMAQAFRNPAHALFDSTSVKNGFLLAFDAWIRLDPQSPNWWWNQIGSQLSLGPAMMLMRDLLTTARIGNGNAILARSWAVHSSMTGENLVWVSKITVWRGSIVDTASLVSVAMDAIVAEIRITSQQSDDLQEDWSFHQHGPQLYSGGYGMGYSSDASDMAQLCRGTQFAFTQDKLGLLSHYILDGQQWMTRGTVIDHSVCGREITRPNSPDKKSAFTLTCANMIAAGAGRSAEFAAFSNRLSAWPAPGGAMLSGNRHFFCSDYMAHQRPACFASVKMSSKRTRGAELVNGEGLKSYYCGDGVTFVYRSGREYYNIFPVWDWTRLPGVTCRRDTAPPPMPASYTGATTFAGGVSDGMLGAAGLDYARNGVTGRKAWFFFDKEIIGLGAGISAAAGKPVCTSVNQCLAKGAVSARAGAGVVAQGFGIHRITQASWVWHDSVGYFFPDGGDSVFAGNSAQTGSWLSINTTGAAAIITDTVFSLWLDHGTAPANATYAYGVIPGIGEDSLDVYVKSGACTVVSNTAALQAVRDNALGACGIIFYASGTVALADTFAVGVDRACAVLVRESADSMEIAVSNPAAVACTVQVTATSRLWGNGAVWNAQTATTTAPFVLPGGLDAGGSVVETFGRHATAVEPASAAPALRAVSIRRIRHGIVVNFGARAQMRGARVTVLDVSGRRIGSAEDRRGAAASLEVGLPQIGSGIVIALVEYGRNAQTFVVPLVRE